MNNPLPSPTLELVDFDGVAAWVDAALFDACGVRVAFTGRAGGCSAPPYDSLNLGGRLDDDPACVARNRKRTLEALGGAGLPLIVPVQVHGTHVLIADEEVPTPEERQDKVEADAVVVTAARLAAQLSFADCLPLVMVAPGGAFAVAHAGWRGALAGISGLAARAPGDAAQCDPAQINAYIGPHICRKCFETGEDVSARFAAEYGADVLADSRHVDLTCAVSTDLLRVGLQAERIADCEACTMCHPDVYYSYRASGGTCGRQGAIAFAVQ